MASQAFNVFTSISERLMFIQEDHVGSGDSDSVLDLLFTWATGHCISVEVGSLKVSSACNSLSAAIDSTWSNECYDVVWLSCNSKAYSISVRRVSRSHNLGLGRPSIQQWHLPYHNGLRPHRAFRWSSSSFKVSSFCAPRDPDPFLCRTPLQSGLRQIYDREFRCFPF